MLNPAEFTFFSPTRIEFGFGKIEAVGQVGVNLGLKRILVVSDPGLLQVGVLDRVLDLLGSMGLGCTSYTDIETNPDVYCVERGVEAFKIYNGDGLVALGGGSPIDVAKAIGIVAAGGFPIDEYGMARKPIEKPIPPLITIPTTAGTGSEVTRSAIITNRKEKIKMAVRSPIGEAHLTSPRVCILDPQLTLSLSERMTVATGLDALSHGVEQLVSRASHPASRALSMEVIRLVFTYLKRAALNGNDIEARAGMLQASMLAGLSMAVGLGAAHALAHSLGAHYNLHHGLAVGSVLPGVMAANLPRCEAEYTRAYRYTEPNLSKKSIHSEANGLIISIIELMKSLRVPDLFEMNSEIDFNLIGLAASEETFLLGTNPVELTKEELVSILSKSYKEVQNV